MLLKSINMLRPYHLSRKHAQLQGSMSINIFKWKPSKQRSLLYFSFFFFLFFFKYFCNLELLCLYAKLSWVNIIGICTAASIFCSNFWECAYFSLMDLDWVRVNCKESVNAVRSVGAGQIWICYPLTRQEFKWG